MVTELKRTTIFLTKKQHDELRKLAFDKRVSMSSLLREAIIEMLEDEEDIRDSVAALKEEGSISLEDFLKEREERLKPEHLDEIRCKIKTSRCKTIKKVK